LNKLEITPLWNSHHSCYGTEIMLEGQFMPGEKSSRCEREIAAAGLTAPALLAAAMAIIVRGASATRANGFAIGRWPAQARKHVFRTGFGHPHNFVDAKRSGGRRKKKMLHDGNLVREHNKNIYLNY